MLGFDIFSNKLFSCLAVFSLIFLSACSDCGTGGEGCALMEAEGLVLVATPVLVATAPVTVPVAWATTRGPDPRVDEGKDNIKLENSFEVEEGVVALTAAQNDLLLVTDYIPTTNRYQTTFWTWQGQASDFAGHQQPDSVVAQSSQKMFFVNQRINKNSVPDVPHSVDMKSGTAEVVSLPDCSFVNLLVLRALSDKENASYCVQKDDRGIAHGISAFDPDTLHVSEMFVFASETGRGLTPISVRDGIIAGLDQKIEWRNFGPDKLSGSYPLNDDLWGMTLVPHSNLVAVALSQYGHAPMYGHMGTIDYHKGKVILLDLKTNEVKLEMPVDNSQIDVSASPDGQYLFVLPSRGHQMDIYDIADLKKMGSLSTGEKYQLSLPVFEENSDRFAVRIVNKKEIYIFTIHKGDNHE